MSLGPVNNNFSQQLQQTKTAAPTPKAEDTRTPEAAQPTNTPEAQGATPTATPETQDATRQLQQGNESQIKNQLDNGWLEAGTRRTRSTRGTRRTAQNTPVRGLGGAGGGDSGGSELA